MAGTRKEPLNLSIEAEVIRAFKERMESAGLSVSAVVELFMRAIVSKPQSRDILEGMERFIHISKTMRDEIKERGEKSNEMGNRICAMIYPFHDRAPPIWRVGPHQSSHSSPRSSSSKVLL